MSIYAKPRSDADTENPAPSGFQLSSPLLEIERLSIHFPAHGRKLWAVRDLSLCIPRFGISCIVGESGCGKSLTAKAILRLTPENAILSGQILFNGTNILGLDAPVMRQIRGQRIGMIFQEPMTSLNPVLSIGVQTAEPLRLHLGFSKTRAQAEVLRLFRQVGIPSPEQRFRDYPHQLSGGMRQRVMIAMALACKPELLLADEPTTALDTTIQGQILRLIVSESRERGMGVLLITHDLGVVAEVAEFVAVMYAGMLVESAFASEFFANPLHPYTQGLMAAAPSRASLGQNRLPTIPGHVPALGELACGCPFEPRCAKAIAICREKVPPIFHNSHDVACWLYAGNEDKAH